MLRVLPVSDLTRPIGHCAVFVSRTKGSLSPNDTLGSQICVIPLTDKDLVDSVKPKYVLCRYVTSSETMEGENGVNPVAIIRSCLKSTLNPLLGTFRREEKGENGGRTRGGCSFQNLS